MISVLVEATVPTKYVLTGHSFLWKADDHEPQNVKWGHCSVKSKVTAHPKEIGRLGIKDLEFFAHVVRLRWLKHKWTNKDGAWTKMEVPCDKIDTELFYTFTVATIGNGDTVPFWKCN